MRQWVKKLADQFDFDWNTGRGAHRAGGDAPSKDEGQLELSEDRATLLFIIDTFSKNLFEVSSKPIRQVREHFDEFAKELLSTAGGGSQVNVEKVLFRFRQFFASYRIDEYAYVQKTFDDFRGIIWDFVDQLAEELAAEKEADGEIKQSLESLKEAVEANSIDDLRFQARHFIDSYIERQTRREQRRDRRIESIKKNLDTVTKRLQEASQAARMDHLTKAFNRRSFDEKCRQLWHRFKFDKKVSSLLILDIDYFKRINDTFGHDVGDFALKECVRILKEIFLRDSDFVARIGGEEFAVLLPDYTADMAMKKAETCLNKFRQETYVHGDHKLKFTISVGVAQIADGERVDDWVKRADAALYLSKKSGRDQATLAPFDKPDPKAA